MDAPVLLRHRPIGDPLRALDYVIVIEFDVVEGKLNGVPRTLCARTHIKCVVVYANSLYTCGCNIVLIDDRERVIDVIVIKFIGYEVDSPKLNRDIRCATVIP